MKMNYMFHNKLCTEIEVDFQNKKVFIKNHTDDLIDRAFGVIENPTYTDFEYFLERRCIPRTRDNLKWYLREIGLDFYDPLSIVYKTQGRMAEDHYWIDILDN